MEDDPADELHDSEVEGDSDEHESDVEDEAPTLAAHTYGSH